MKYDKEKLTTALDILYYMLSTNSLEQSKCPKYYLIYEQDAEVRDALELCTERFGLYLCRRDNALYLSSGVGNKVFGVTNADIKYELGKGFNNPEMYTVFFIMHIIVTEFYEESMYDTHRQKLPKDYLLETIDSKIRAMSDFEDLQKLSEDYKFNFSEIKELWDSLPTRELRENSDDEKQKGTGSKITMMNETIYFMEKHDLVIEHNNAVYPTNRFKAVIAEAYNNQDIQKDIREFIESLTFEGGVEDAKN
ncbi:DUF6063 family protein [Methanomethylovorans sp.]|uniref:DUF6063 family protein n=1 Tax=Methanomethylovorans sp. TaxID=2758717 RepID=UPI00351C0A6F